MRAFTTQTEEQNYKHYSILQHQQQKETTLDIQVVFFTDTLFVMQATNTNKIPRAEA